MSIAVRAEGPVKRYGAVTALDGLDLEVRRRIGLSGQYAAVDEDLTGRENLVMIGRLTRLRRAAARRRADELLERFMLTDAADRPVKGYSGGMRRRLDLAGALVAAPEVLVIDRSRAVAHGSPDESPPGLARRRSRRSPDREQGSRARDAPRRPPPLRRGPPLELRPAGSG